MTESTESYTIDHRLSAADRNVHSVWDNSLDPVLTIESGDVVRFDCRDALDGQVGLDSTADDLANASFDPVHPLTGPVYVEGAEPGDVLEIELLDLQHKGWGFTGYMPGEMGLGLLPEDFEEAGYYAWDLEGDIGKFVNGIEVPLDPFPGTLGVAPAEDGAHDTLPPRNVGGNMDVKHMTKGSTVYLPIEVEGALFSTADCHAAQGDGEVCVTGIESPMFVTARLSIRKEMNIKQPQFKTNGPFTPSGQDEPMYATTGIAEDLMIATKKAVRHMIDHLEANHDLTRGEAYMLCSAIVDLKVSEVVDAPNWIVTAYLPESIFPEN
ncbi:acetamidase/formamidase family protein [Natronocalculus amylovorans]|uniref:Acetamidase/formamidase family protein n=1 Tax=Natronocalculus amylovorans TaxID=2917812 RepID=A0AAE3K877_9EURY|nr:acetamidase/formamidase family protein [Natronocalculus amylovorans]MCL9817002.1 acetamidase/formamidase family protein [Natronocalculus amylovorans]NUE02949.1 acetamidase/formamidase family protein [Halorubraceae archaeon YAN]